MREFFKYIFDGPRLRGNILKAIAGKNEHIEYLKWQRKQLILKLRIRDAEKVSRIIAKEEAILFDLKKLL